MIRKNDGKERGRIKDKKKNGSKATARGGKKEIKLNAAGNNVRKKKLNKRNGGLDHRSGPQNHPSPPPHPVTISEGIQNTPFCQNDGI